MPGQTFTTYINAKRTGSVDAEFAQLEQRASRSLSGIQSKADAASRALAGLTRGGGSAGRSPISTAYLNGFDQAKVKADRLAESNARLARENSTLVRSLRTTGQTLQIVQGPLGPIAGRVTAAADALVRLTGVTLGLAGAGAALFAYTRAANQFVEIRSKLAVLYDSQQDVNKAMTDVAGIANRARAGLEPVVDLYSKLTLAADQLGFSQQRVARLTELATKAATLSGGTTQSREAGLYQFSQGISSGVLQGDELRSIRENLPALARELSQGLGKLPEFKGIDTSIGKLKTLGEQGKLTADVIARAMEASAGDIEQRFSRLPPTLSASFTALQNNATMFIGRFEEATGVVGTLASGVLLLGNNLNVVVGILGGVAAGWAAVAVQSKASDFTKNISNQIAALRAQQTTLRANLEIAVNQRTATVQQTVALAAEEAQVRKNIAALEAELIVQKELAAQGNISAKAGLPGGVQQRDTATAASKRITRELADEVEHLSVVQTAAASTGRRLESQNKAVDVATKGAGKATSLLKLGLSNLVGIINPVGIAVGLATTAFLAWATAESEAEKNARKVEDAQRKLAIAIDLTTGKVIEQNSVLLANAKLNAQGGFNAAATQHAAVRQQIYALGQQFRGYEGTSGRGLNYGFTGDTNRSLTSGQQQFLTALDKFARGGGAAELQASVDAIAKADPSLRSLADQVTRLAGEATTSARSMAQFQSAQRILSGQGSDEDRRRVGGDFSGGQVQGGADNRNLIQEAENLRKRLRDQRFAAETQMNESLENLEKRKSKLTADDYVRERAQILATYDTAIRSLDAQDERARQKAEREEQRRQRAHERELARIARENEARDKRTEFRQDALNRWSDEPKAIIRAQHDIRELNDLVGKTMNGLQAITEDNPLGQGIYTQAMADADAQRIEDGLQRPYEKFMEQRQRDANISDLILSGRDNEAEALRRSYDLYDQIGSITMDQYESILAGVKAEQRINDALEQRERLLAPLKESVGALRGDIAEAIDQLLNGANPLKVGKNFLKSLLAQYNRGTAEQLAAKITGGLDQRVRDLISGSTKVDSKIAEYIGALDKGGAGANRLETALDKTAQAADKAAAALNAIPPAGGAPGVSGANVGGGALGALAQGGSSIITALAATSGQIPRSFYKPGVSVGKGIGDDVIYKALGGLALITDNLRSQGRQNSYFAQGLTTARVSDHTTTQDAWDVRLPAGMTFAKATALIRQTAKDMGVELVKALDETASGGTGRHGHYVFSEGAGRPSAAQSNVTQIAGTIGSTPAQVAVESIKVVADTARSLKSASPATVGPDGSIVITGTRTAGQPQALPKGGAVGRAIFGSGMEETYNAMGKAVGDKLDKALGTKFLGNLGSKLGTALQGAQTGAMVAGIGKMLWGKFSTTGAQIGGAIGSFLPIPGGDIIGSIAGGIIGGLFKKTKKASATITGSGGSINVGDAVGNSGKREQAADSMAGSVGDTLQRIADALGATIGNFAVSIGVRKDKYVVDLSGKGRTKGPGTPSFKDEEDAIRAAVMDAIQDGALQGISAASQTILKKGKDLERQLNKAIVIESIPKRLMAIKDPIKAAIMDLNKEFSDMISYLKEGGATAEQFAQAQELYDLERQQAIERATSQSIGAIQDMIDEMLGGQSSPLNKLTVYQNAQQKLAGFATDIQAGKTVNSDDFLKAASNFQDASRELNGSSQSFFSDFDYLLGLLNKAKDNVTGTQTSPSNLPPSPFDDASIQALIHGTTDVTGAINTQTGVLGGLLGDILDRLNGGGSGGSTALDILPGSYGGGGGGSIGGGAAGRNLVNRA